MWSGSVPNQGEPFSSQMVGSWALNPSVPYMNMPHEQVDWATLAQQWIKMKEEVPQFEKEGGEAPMDITKEDSVVTTPPNPPEWPTNTPDSGSWSGNWSWNQAGGAWCWNPVGTQVAKPTGPSTFTPGYPTIPEVPSPIIPQPTAFSYTPSQAPSSNETFPPNHTYWSGANTEGKESWDTHRTHKKHTSIEHTPEIDPAKRKQLPAWIREGLEKMERDKLKKAELERLDKLRKDELSRQSDLHITDSNGITEGPPVKSKFETESDDSDREGETKSKQEEKPRRSRFDWQEMPAAFPPQPKFRTKEQILQSVMVDVRKILTQVLMEVTTEEIKKAVDEEIRHFKRKAPATTVRKTAALTSLTGKLGLGIYESDSDSGSDPEEKVKNDPDSDQELRERIEKLKSEFIFVERAIEIEATEQEERERKQLRTDCLNKEESPINHEEQVQPLREDSTESSDKNRMEDHVRDNSEQKRAGRSVENKSENSKESNSSSTSNNFSKTSKKLVTSRRSSFSNSSSEESSSTSSSSSRSSDSRYKRKRGKKSTGERRSRSSRYSRSRTRSRSRSRSRSRRDRARHGSECRRRTKRRSSRDRKNRNRRSSSSSSNGYHRSRKSNHRR